MCKTVVWNPWHSLLEPPNGSKYAVLVLNVPLDFKRIPGVLERLWSTASVRVTVDGGTDRWFTWLAENGYDTENIKPPHLVTGDLDSISKRALDFYTNSTHTQVLHTPDQLETDYTKALRELQKYLSAKNMVIDYVFVVAESVGRFDQIMANINTLFKARNFAPGLKIYQLASDSMTWLLDQGSHEIAIPATLRQHQEWCALIPVGSPCQVTTTGLKWNLNKGTLDFGKFVSSSNTYGGEAVVNVITNSPVVWSMGIETLFGNNKT